MRRRFPFFALLIAATAALARGGDPALKSGPQPKEILPGPFDAIVVNVKSGVDDKDAPSDKAKDPRFYRPHCLVCANGLNPAVLVFAREPGMKKFPLAELLEKLDESLLRHDKAQLNGYVVFLSPDAKSSLNEGDETDAEKLVDEATKRRDLLKRLDKLAEPLKKVVVAAYAQEGPKGYNVNPKAEVTVVLFNRLKVLANWSFEEGALTEDHIAAITKGIDAALAKSPKKKTDQPGTRQ